MKILILGKYAQLGRCLEKSFKASNFQCIFTSKKDLDITNLLETKDKITEINPDLIINAAAYTAVDTAEKEKELSNLINNVAVENLANISKNLDCILLHISTDFVFDGEGRTSYAENSATNPICEYGRGKLKGEKAIQESGCNYLIIRTSWLFSAFGNNFLKTMLVVAENKKIINIVGDQIGRPTFAQDLSDAICEIVPKISSNNLNLIYHYSGNQECSWAEFANEIFEAAYKKNIIRKKPAIKVIETKDFPSPARRPLYSSLDPSLIKVTFGVNPSDWRLGIRNTLESLVNI